jgi:nucleoside-diphosphate-sugar epimerase
LRPPASEVERLVSDYSKAEGVLEWTPETDLEDGLRRTISWIDRFLGLYKARIYNV